MLDHHQNRKARWITRWVTLLVKGITVTLTGFCSLAFAAASDPLANSVDIAGVGNQTTSATTVAGEYIAWREWIIDSPELAGFALNGSDGLVVGDLDNDGREDIVSVHESDSEYDSSEFDPDYIPDSEGHGCYRNCMQRHSGIPPLHPHHISHRHLCRDRQWTLNRRFHQSKYHNPLRKRITRQDR